MLRVTRAFRKPGASVLARALAGSTAGPGGGPTIGHHVDEEQVQRQRRSLTNSSRSCGWTSAGRTPTSEGNADEAATGQSLGRAGSPPAMLTTRLRGMFSSRGNGPWWLAVHLLEKGRQEGIKCAKVYNVVLKMIATDEWMTEDKLKEIDRLFAQMVEEDGLAPEAHSYGHLIYAHAQAKDEKTAMRLLEEMVSRDLKPDRRTLSSMIVAHSWGSIEDMRRVAAEMRAQGLQPTRRANSAMIGALRRTGDMEGIMQVAKDMVENEQALTEAALVVAIKAAASLTGQAEFSRKLLQMHSKAKHRPQEALYVCVMVALRNASLHEECLACWRELVLLDGLGDVKLDERTYNLALGSAVKAERWEEVEAIFDMMEAHELEPNLATWRSMVDVWSSEDTGDEARLDRMFGTLDRRNWQPDREVQLHAAAAYARSGAWHKAMVWFDPALAEGKDLGKCENELLVMSLSGMGRHGEIKEVWTRNSGPKGQRNLFRADIIGKMAEAARELDDSEWALELLSVSMASPARGKGTGLDSTHVRQEAVRVLTKAGRLEEAANVLRQARPNQLQKEAAYIPATLEGILAAFGELAQPAEVVAFVEELRANGCDPYAPKDSDAKTTSPRMKDAGMKRGLAQAASMAAATTRATAARASIDDNQQSLA
ncbi:unnamed protein product [Scytosiphon promiscuus]